MNYYKILNKNDLIKNNKGLFIVADYGDNKNKAMEFTLELMNTENINGSVAVLNLPEGLTKVNAEFKGTNEIYQDKQNNVDITYIEERLKELTATSNLKVAVIDYETIETADNNYSDISNKLKSLSEELNILIFVFPKISDNYKYTEDESLQIKNLENKGITDFSDVVMLINTQDNILKNINIKIK